MQQDRIYELFQQRAKIRHPFETANPRSVVTMDTDLVFTDPEQLLTGVYGEAKGRAVVLSRLVTAGVRSWAENFGSIRRDSFEGLFQKPNKDDRRTVVDFGQKEVRKLVYSGETGRPGELTRKVNEAVRDSLLEEFSVQAEEAARDGDDRRFASALDMATGVLLAHLPSGLEPIVRTAGVAQASREVVSRLGQINPDLKDNNNTLDHSHKIVELFKMSSAPKAGLYGEVAANENSVSLMQQAINTEPVFRSHFAFTEGMTVAHYAQVIAIDGARDPEVSDATAFIMEKWLRANMTDSPDLRGHRRFFIPNRSDRYAVQIGADLFANQTHNLMMAVAERVAIHEMLRSDPDFLREMSQKGF